MFVSYNTIEAFALKRNSGLSFPFLKENGELLSIIANSNLLVEPGAIALYQPFYDRAYAIYELYPQFARFILGIVTDLEALGQKGETATQIAEDMVSADILDFDTADSRRLDTLSLFSRLNVNSLAITQHEDRVHKNVARFTKSPHQFTHLNKPLFYELTHMVFFITDYGRRAWPIDTDIASCLKYAGVLAFLDDDFDLLAEICISLRFLALEPPSFWEDAVANYLSSMRITYNTNLKSALNSQVDEYHPYFVANWLLALKGLPVFTEIFGRGAPNFSAPSSAPSALFQIANQAHNSILHPTNFTVKKGMEFKIERSKQVEKLMHCQDTHLLTRNVLSKISHGEIDLCIA